MVVGVLLLSAAFAGSPALKPQGKPGAGYLVLFDASKMATIEGTITRIYVVPSAKVWLTSVHLLVRTSQGELKVELAPSWFLDNQELHLAVDDRVTITGSQVKTNGVESLIATEVKRNKEVLQLRANDGMPVWVAWRQGEAEEGASR